MMKNHKSFPSFICLAVFMLLLLIVIWSFLLPILIIGQFTKFASLSVRKVCFMLISSCVGLFTTSVIGVIEFLAGTKYICYGDADKFPTHESALVICNHPTLFDWMYLWGWFARHSTLDNLKIVLKDELSQFPFAGWCIQSALFLFLTRQWAQDESNMNNLIDYWCVHASSIKVIIFPEGTNLGVHSQPKAKAYLAEHHMPDMNETLPPKTTGFVALFNRLTCIHNLIAPQPQTQTQGDVDIYAYKTLEEYVAAHTHIDAVYNMTIAYSCSRVNEDISLFKGLFPHIVHVNCQRVSVHDLITQVKPDLPFPALTTGEVEGVTSVVEGRRAYVSALDERLKDWVVEQFYVKDRVLTEFYNHPQILNPQNPPLLFDMSSVVPPKPSDLHSQFVAVIVALTLILLFLRSVLNGNMWVIGYVLVYNILSFGVLNVCKASLWRQLALFAQTHGYIDTQTKIQTHTHTKAD